MPVDIKFTNALQEVLLSSMNRHMGVVEITENNGSLQETVTYNNGSSTVDIDSIVMTDGRRTITGARRQNRLMPEARYHDNDYAMYSAQDVYEGVLLDDRGINFDREYQSLLEEQREQARLFHEHKPSTPSFFVMSNARVEKKSEDIFMPKTMAEDIVNVSPLETVENMRIRIRNEMRGVPPPPARPQNVFIRE